jgi:hypothetical protein
MTAKAALGPVGERGPTRKRECVILGERPRYLKPSNGDARKKVVGSARPSRKMTRTHEKFESQ